MTEFSSDNQPATRGSGEPIAASNRRRKIVTDALMLALNREIAHKGVMTKRINIMADKLVEKACEGDVSAIRETADRVEGKAAQALELSSDPDNPLAFAVTLVHADKG